MAPAASIRVCTSTSCANTGGHHVLRDIEELADGQCSVIESMCLGKCGMGPNAEVVGSEAKAKPKTFIGLLNFKQVLDFVQNEKKSHLPVRKEVETVGQLKYDARRQQDSAKKLALLDQGFAHLGGEVAQAQKSQPALYSQLLVIRATEYLQSAPGSALVDSKLALSLAPKSVQAQLTLAEAYEVTLHAAEAIKALETVMDAQGVNRSLLRRTIKRLQKMQDDEDDKTEEKKKAAMEKLAPPRPEVKLPPAAVAKAQPQRKAGGSGSKAKPKATPKAAAEKKPEAPAPAPAPKAAAAPAPNTPAPAPQEDEWIDWRLEDVTPLNHDCLKFTFKSTDLAATAKHRFNVDDTWHVDIMKEATGPGQESLVRSYTPMSTAEEYKAGTLVFMIKIYPDGRMTTHLAQCKVGDLVPICNPHGTVKAGDYTGGLAIIAGGSAVTVALQLMHCVFKAKADAQVHLALCNRRIEDVLFADVMEAMLSEKPSLRVVHFISMGAPVASIGISKATYRSGRISAEFLEPVDKGFKGIVSGPMGLCEAGLGLWRYSSRNLELFEVLDELPPKDPEVVPDADAEVEVKCRSCGGSGMTILEKYCVCEAGRKLNIEDNGGNVIRLPSGALKQTKSDKRVTFRDGSKEKVLQGLEQPSDEEMQAEKAKMLGSAADELIPIKADTAGEDSTSNGWCLWGLVKPFSACQQSPAIGAEEAGS
eukprot:TRINITY_DN35269_c0_g1_i1.p1 TRINITY_DN35269_c0_g1~~TRINITY_DN35269_c0_g1_i1.p1  ORF type:complete len:704 (-),score=173.04 TRINITY_DN35269_c0_g1_i1:135-2246(-)